MRRTLWSSWKSQGGLQGGGESFVKFFLRACRALRCAMSACGGGGIAGAVQNHFGLLKDWKRLHAMDAPLKEGVGKSSQHFYPLLPMSVGGKILRGSQAGIGGDEAAVLYEGGNAVVASLNWMHGVAGGATSDGLHLSLARIAKALQALVLTDEPILSYGGLDQFLRQSQFYGASGAVLPLGVRGGVPDKAADVKLADHLDSYDPSLAAQVREPGLVLLPVRKRQACEAWLHLGFFELPRIGQT